MITKKSGTYNPREKRKQQRTDGVAGAPQQQHQPPGGVAPGMVPVAIPVQPPVVPAGPIGDGEEGTAVRRVCKGCTLGLGWLPPRGRGVDTRERLPSRGVPRGMCG